MTLVDDKLDERGNRWPKRLFSKKNIKLSTESRLNRPAEVSHTTEQVQSDDSPLADQVQWERAVSRATQRLQVCNCGSITETVQNDSEGIQERGKSLSEFTEGSLELRLVDLCYMDCDVSKVPHIYSSLETSLNLAQDGLDSGRLPELTKTGTGGSYFLRDASGSYAAVLKPTDEEPRASNNPRGIVGPSVQGLKKGVIPGQGAIREVAAYLLDHGRFAGVPPTGMVCCQSKENRNSKSGTCKIGSLQKFVVSDSDCEELGPSSFSVEQVHKICVIDMRFANTDRNGANILAQRQAHDGTWELIPIDHGYCFPDTFEDICFEWKYWRQAKQPFNQDTVKYIAELDAEEDIRTLEANGVTLSKECHQIFRACTMLLKKAAARGLTPYDISKIMCRDAFEPSPLETLYQMAQAVYKTGDCRSNVPACADSSTDEASDADRLMATLGVLMDEYLANEVKEN